MENLEYHRLTVPKLTDEEIKTKVKQGVFTLQELLDYGIISQTRYNELNMVKPEDHYYSLIHRKGNAYDMAFYTHEKIRELIAQKVITEAELSRRNIFTDDELDEILLKPIKHRTPPPVPDVLPPLLPNRLDVFVLGIIEAGKTSFMAGLLKYAHSMGRYHAFMMRDESNKIINGSGISYATFLISSINDGLPVPPTSRNNMNYMAIDFLDDERKEHPLSFIEMSGEVFEECSGKDESEIKPKLREYLFSPNKKMFFCVLQYHVNLNKKSDQWMHFDWFLGLLESNGALQQTKAIAIMITKWDLSADQSKEAAIAFLKANYLNLFEQCKSFSEKYNIQFRIITFSLGKFNARNEITYDPRDSAMVFQWLSEITPTLNTRKPGVFGKLFNN